MELSEQSSRPLTRTQRNKANKRLEESARRQNILASNEVGPNDIIVDSNLGNVKAEASVEIKVEHDRNDTNEHQAVAGPIVKHEALVDEIVIEEYLDISDESVEETFSQEDDNEVHSIETVNAVKPETTPPPQEIIPPADEISPPLQETSPLTQETSPLTQETIPPAQNIATVPEVKTSKKVAKEFKCPRCPKISKSKSGYRHHLETHQVKFKCKICGRMFAYKTGLKQHQILHDESKGHRCQLCPKKCSTKRDLNRHHQSMHTAGVKQKCNLCSVEFRSDTAMIRHKFKNHSITPTNLFRCPHCPKLFFKEGEFKSHESTHTGNKQFPCKICGKKLRYPHHLQWHMRIHKTRFECDTCGKSFVWKTNYKLHLNTHTDNRPYKCTTCHKTFGFPSTLKRHQRTHADGKHYQCVFCGKGYTTKGVLDDHIIQHVGEQPYRCVQCDVVLTSRESLYVHKKRHSHETFICLICNKSFAASRGLRDHNLRFHDENKPIALACIFCKRQCPKLSVLFTHLRSHTKEEPYACTHCPKVFPRGYELTRHERARHNK